MPDIKHFDPDAVLDRVVDLFWEHGADTTGIAEVVAVTGLSRSSLYATFGGKSALYAAALSRYLDQRSRPVFAALAADDRGLPAIDAFFDRLVLARCTGAHARWGCLVTNAHASASRDLPEVRQALAAHHVALRTALRQALGAAAECGQLQPGLEVEGMASALVHLAYGINLRSRAGAEVGELLSGVRAVLDSLMTTEER